MKPPCLEPMSFGFFYPDDAPPPSPAYREMLTPRQRQKSIIRDLLAITEEMPEHVGVGALQLDDGSRCLNGELLHRRGLMGFTALKNHCGSQVCTVVHGGALEVLVALGGTFGDSELFNVLCMAQSWNDAGKTWGEIGTLIKRELGLAA